MGANARVGANDDAGAAAALTARGRARRGILLVATTSAALAYVGYFAAPMVSDGTARSCALLAGSRDGFTARAGATRARMMWAAGDAAGAREALLRNGAIEAAVGLACREGMDVKARLAASAFVREAMADARGVDAARRMRETLERCARDGRAKTGWFGKVRPEDERVVGLRENIRETLAKL